MNGLMPTGDRPRTTESHCGRSDRWRNRVLPMSFESWSASQNGLDAFGDVKFLHRSLDSVGGVFPWSLW